jgi:hypothetical protein
MKSEKKPAPCPLAEGERNPIAPISRADEQPGAITRRAPEISPDCSGAESIDGKTANNFAEFRRNALR